MTDQDVTLYGIKTCDTCRKAVRALEAAGRSITFVDVRATPPSADLLAAWLARVGEGLVNTRSTTWRGLQEAERALPPVEVLRAHPTVMKRPVIIAGDAVYLGWSKPVKAALLPVS